MKQPERESVPVGGARTLKTCVWLIDPRSGETLSVTQRPGGTGMCG
jgi:hypothetical protein